MSAVDFDLTLDPDDPNAHPPSDSKNLSLPIDTDSYHPFFYRRPRPNVGTAPICPNLRLCDLIILSSQSDFLKLLV